jgi:hypothetical protein
MLKKNQAVLFDPLGFKGNPDCPILLSNNLRALYLCEENWSLKVHGKVGDMITFFFILEKRRNPDNENFLCFIVGI